MAYKFDWGVLLVYRHLLWQGLVLTVQLSALGMVLSLVLGGVIGLGRRAEAKPLRWLCSAYIEFFRNIPLIVQLFFWYFAVGLEAFPAAVIGLTVYTSAYIAEVIRSGLQSIRRTQLEAARSLMPEAATVRASRFSWSRREPHQAGNPAALPMRNQPRIFLLI